MIKLVCGCVCVVWWIYVHSGHSFVKTKIPIHTHYKYYFCSIQIFQNNSLEICMDFGSLNSTHTITWEKKTFWPKSIWFRKVVKVDWDMLHEISNRDIHTDTILTHMLLHSSSITQPTRMCMVFPCNLCICHSIRWQTANEWMNEWINEWRSEWLSEWVSERARAKNIKLVKCLRYLIYLPCAVIANEYSVCSLLCVYAFVLLWLGAGFFGLYLFPWVFVCMYGSCCSSFFPLEHIVVLPKIQQQIICTNTQMNR